MTEITALNGTILHIDDNSITILTGPAPGDPPSRSYVSGPAPAPIPTDESASALLARIRPKIPLARFTRPEGSPIWLQGAAITMVRPPAPGETPLGETVGSVLFVSGVQPEAVQESVADARTIIDQHGGNV